MARKSKIEEYTLKIKEYYYKNRVIPNFETTASLLGLKSKGSIHKLFKVLTEQKYLIKDGRSFEAGPMLTSLPLFESIQAGFPTQSTTQIPHQNVNIQDFMVNRPNSTVLLKVKGSSMIDEGILDSDIVIVDTSIKCKPYDIVIAIVDGNYTMKYIMRDKKGMLYLRAANKDFPDIYPKNEMQIFGVVTGVLRKYR